MQSPSLSLENFNKSIVVSEELLKRAKVYQNRPTAKNITIIHGLRGGALVFMVASFENYLKEAMLEMLTDLSNSPTFNFNSLPLEIIHHNCKKTCDLSLHPPETLDQVQKISNFEKGSRYIVNRKINPEAFSFAIRGNPSSEQIKILFNSIGHKDFFTRIKTKFEKKTGVQSVAPTYIKDKLDFIIEQRHKVAHTATPLGLSHKDFEDYIVFLKTLSQICDEELTHKIKLLNK